MEVVLEPRTEILPRPDKMRDPQWVLPLFHGRYKSVLDYQLQSSSNLSLLFSTMFVTVLSSLKTLSLLSLHKNFIIVFIPSVHIFNTICCFCHPLHTYKAHKIPCRRPLWMASFLISLFSLRIILGNSLALQWLGLCTFTAVAQVQAVWITAHPQKKDLLFKLFLYIIKPLNP